MKSLLLLVVLLAVFNNYCLAQKNDFVGNKTVFSHDVNITQPNLPITINPFIDVSELSVEGSLDKEKPFIYPNPSSGQFFIESSQNITSIEIYETNGKKVFYRSESYPLLNLNYLPKGLYLMVISTDSGKMFIEKIYIL